MRFMLLLLSVIAINCQNVVNQNSTVHHYVPSLTSHSQEEESEYDEDHYPPPPPQVHREHEVIYDEIPHVGSNGFEPPISGGGATSPNTMSRSRTIETKYGKVKGLSITIAQGRLNPLKNTIVEVYVGIPYASPPIKSHRFGPTQTAMPWEGVRDAIKPGFVCPQMLPEIRNETAALKDMPRGYLEYLKKIEPYLRNQSEDCLFLNIYTPNGPEPKVRPVIVYIHGGRFSWGSGNLWDGTVLAAYGDVVFVSINYRLNVLGFLNVHASIPNAKPRVANYGLMDQIAALHWIKENIIKFGGDPENISLMGYEAGAACINFLMTSPAVTPGLFHRAVLIGGSAHAPWALVPDPAAATSALAQALNCSLPSNATLLPTPAPYTSSFTKSQIKEDPVFECIKNKHFSEFSGFTPPKFGVDFGPSIDGVVIKPNFRATSESQMGKRDVAKKYDVLLGLSSLEKMTAFSENDLQAGFENQRRDAILRTLIRNLYRFHLNEILATITNEYTDWEKSSQHPIPTRDLTISAVTDCLALAPVVAVSESRQINRGFFYVFEHATKDGLYNYIAGQGQRTGGVGGEELNYMFGTPLVEPLTGHVLPFIPQPIPSNFTKTEMALSEQIITFLSNFAHTGDPNEPLKGEMIWPVSKERNRYKNTPWEGYDKVHQKYLEISSTKIRPRSHYRSHQMAIWLRLVPELQRSGAQFVSGFHNRMKGGNDASLYVGKLRHPLDGDDPLLHAPSLLDMMGMGYGRGLEDSSPSLLDAENEGSGVGPPAPPTTCFSPLASSSSPAVGAVEKQTNRKQQNESQASTSSSFPFAFAPYSTALSVTIAVGCSLLILNVFILAIVYYQRDKRMNKSNLPPNTNGPSSSSNKYHGHGEPPELLKSNSTTCSSLQHAATSPTLGLMHQTSLESQGGKSSVSYGSTHSQCSISQQQQQLAQQALAQRGILLSPAQAHYHHMHHLPTTAYTTLPRSNGGIGIIQGVPKPPPPPRSFGGGTLPHNVMRNSNTTSINLDELKV